MNYDQLKNQVRQIEADMDGAGELSEERITELKRERAALYAKQVDSGESELQGGAAVLHIEVGGEGLAISADQILAVELWTDPGVLPLTPSAILGVVPFRGEAVLLLSFHALRGLSFELSPETRLVVVNWRDGAVALVADRVHDVRLIRPSDLEPPESHEWLAREAVPGVLSDGVALLDLEQLAGSLHSGLRRRSREATT